MYTKPYISLIIFCFFALTPMSSFSAPVAIDSSVLEDRSDSDTHFGIGSTSSIAQRPFIGVDDQATSLPYFSFSYKDFYIEGLNAGYKLVKNRNFHLDLLITPRYFEVKESFAPNGELNGIDETKQTFFAGLTSQYRADYATYTFQLLSDINESDGAEINATISKRFKLTNTFSLSPSFGINYQDQRLVDHFYGVQVNEVVINRPLYKGVATLNSNVSLTSIWNVTQHIQLIGLIKNESLGKGITDSPIVDEKSIVSFAIGAIYRF